MNWVGTPGVAVFDDTVCHLSELHFMPFVYSQARALVDFCTPHSKSMILDSKYVQLCSHIIRASASCSRATHKSVTTLSLEAVRCPSLRKHGTPFFAQAMENCPYL